MLPPACILRIPGLYFSYICNRISNAVIDNAPGTGYDEVFDSLQGAGITAVYTTENNLGVSLIAEAQARGVKVPEDLSIISFDDHVQASLIRPALSVVRQPTAEIGKGAVTVLLDVVEGKEASVATKLLEPVVILRESVRRI